MSEHDTVERLRSSDGFEVVKELSGSFIRADTRLMREAADEIEQLRAELDAIPADLIEATNEIGRLRVALERLIHAAPGECDCESCKTITAALRHE